MATPKLAQLLRVLAQDEGFLRWLEEVPEEDLPAIGRALARPKKKDSSAQRMRRLRARRKGEEGAVAAAPEPPPTPPPAAKREGPAPKLFDLPEREMPAGLNVPEFVAVWQEWVSYRKAKRQTMTRHTIELQWKFLEKIGPVLGIASIRQSMFSGWTGLFEVKDGRARGADSGGGGPGHRVRAPEGKYDGLPIIEGPAALPPNTQQDLFGG